MNYAAINSVFSTKVASLLSNGYMICTNTMNGSQREIAHIHFCKKNAEGEIEHYALILEDCGWYSDDKTLPRLDSIVMTFMKSNELKGDLKSDTRVTLWRDEKHCEIIDSVRFWKIADDRYTASIPEAFAIADKRRNRCRCFRETTYRQDIKVTVNSNTRKLFAKLFNNHKSSYQKRVKAVDIDEITLIRNNDSHYISILAAGKRNDLHI